VMTGRLPKIVEDWSQPTAHIQHLLRYRPSWVTWVFGIAQISDEHVFGGVRRILPSGRSAAKLAPMTDHSRHARLLDDERLHSGCRETRLIAGDRSSLQPVRLHPHDEHLLVR
jgi:hypothetical protein